MIEVFIETKPKEYQNKVQQLQRDGWTIDFIQVYVENNAVQWVITARDPNVNTSRRDN